MPQWQSDQLQINSTIIHYTRTGGDKPPLLLVHGYTDNGLYWTRVTQALEADYDLVMPDARGHGNSPGPDETYTSDLHAADLAGVIEALGLGQPVVVGHSMGAISASLLAARYPDRVSAIVLVDPPWHIKPGPVDEAQRQGWQAWKQNIIEHQRQPHDALIALCKQQNPSWHPIDLETWAAAELQFDVRTFDFFQIMPRRWQEVVTAIRCPVLLMIGDSDLSGLVTPEIAQEAVALAPNVHIAHIAHAGHSIQRDQFDSFMAAVQAFLNAQ